MSLDDKTPKDLVRFPSPPPAPALGAPFDQEPRGFLDGMQQRATAPPTEITTTPGTEDARREAQRRADLLAMVRGQEYALPAVTVESTFWGVVVGALTRFGIAWLFGWRK
ncbi:MAG: hypothetical protein Q8S13_06425 [Dehalococcoidia bacterium]|nr:hypothetical protein [Dehalococcoidia bacterium]